MAMFNKTFWVPLLLALAAYVLLPLPGESAPLSKRIDDKRAQVEAKKRKEGVLSTTIQRYNTRIGGLQGEIRGTQKRLGAVQSELDDKRAELLRVRDDLDVARYRLELDLTELSAMHHALSKLLYEL